MIETLLMHSFGSAWNVLKFLHGRRINWFKSAGVNSVSTDQPYFLESCESLSLFWDPTPKKKNTSWVFPLGISTMILEVVTVTPPSQIPLNLMHHLFPLESYNGIHRNGRNKNRARKLGDDRVGEQHISGEPRWSRYHCWSTLAGSIRNHGFSMDVWCLINCKQFSFGLWSSGFFITTRCHQPFETPGCLGFQPVVLHVLPPDFLWRHWVWSQLPWARLIFVPFDELL